MSGQYQWKGWVCRRDSSHTGPCALVPTRWTRVKLWLRGVGL